MSAFLQAQAEAQERFEKREEERFKKEMEIDERQRREDRDHQERMIILLGQLFQPRQ